MSLLVGLLMGAIGIEHCVGQGRAGQWPKGRAHRTPPPVFAQLRNMEDCTALLEETMTQVKDMELELGVRSECDTDEHTLSAG